LRALTLAVIGLLVVGTSAGFGSDTHLHDSSLPAGPSSARSEDSATAELKKELQTLFSKNPQGASPGFAILVKKKQIVVFAEGLGFGDLRSKSPITVQTNFRLASCTKQFTAMAIMLLEHDGKVKYDETLTGIFPEFPEYGKNITIRNLLNHTSGLPDYEDLMERAEKSKGPTWTAENQIQDREVLQLLEKESSGKFAPGRNWEYSNSGYVVLGLIVAKRSGKSFGEFLRERIFSPLKMEHTLVFEKGKNEVANRAFGHTAIATDRGSRDFSSFHETDQSSTSATQGDGGIYSNLEDLSKWDDALRNHTLLSEKEFAPALTAPKLPPNAEEKLAEDVPNSMRRQAVAYGFGWFLDPNTVHPMSWHYGETIGFKTAILRYSKDDVTVIFLANRTDMDQGEIALKAAKLFLSGN
jgi:CubicO group peptidase (beta-lactamase class C family)